MKRIQSIDVVRGLAMLIMAIDHLREFIFISTGPPDPTNLAQTTSALFFTRWITHFCAPTFVFLAGTSAYLSVQAQADTSASRRFLFTRGLWLIFLEFTVITFAIWFDVAFRSLLFQVIATMGFGFVLLSGLLKVPIRYLALIGAALVAGHQALNSSSLGQMVPVQALFNFNLLQLAPDRVFILAYPIMPWFGILLLGYCFGPQLQRTDSTAVVRRYALGALGLFVVLRGINLYGDPQPWSTQSSPSFTILSFLNVSKYPPSLLFTLLFVGISLMIMAFSEKLPTKLRALLSVYGKVPLFYYLVHWYAIRLLSIVVFMVQGYQWSDFRFGAFQQGKPEGVSGVNLLPLYLIWLGLMVALYPLCRWYGQFKARHRQYGWLRYL